MKSVLSFKLAVLTGFLATLIYIIAIFSHSDLGTYGGLFLLCFCPLVLVFVVLWCYAVVYLEQKKVLAPHIIFRFFIPLLLLSFIAWMSTRSIYISKFQNYSLKMYLQKFGTFSVDFLLPLTLIAALVSIVLTIRYNSTK